MNSLELIRELQKLYCILGNNNTCIGKETLTVTGSSIGLTNIPVDANYALMVCESSVTSGTVLRYWESGDLPTTTDGIPRSHDSAWDISSKENLTRFKVIQTQAGTHKIFIQYYK